MDYLIRECRTEDVATVVELCARHAAHERADYEPAGKEGMLKELLFREDARLFCLVVEAGNAGREGAEAGAAMTGYAEAGGNAGRSVVGYATYTFDYSTWDAGKFLYMDCLYLEPAYRGLHIGEVLVRELAAIARREGCLHMEWQTPDHNEGAIRFYRRMGAEGKEKIRFTLTNG